MVWLNSIMSILAMSDFSEVQIYFIEKSIETITYRGDKISPPRKSCIES